MIKSSKSIFSLFILFLCFLFSSRYIQRIIFEGDLISSPLLKLNLRSKECEPKEDSILTNQRNNDSNLLILIIDGYPNPRAFKHIAGYESDFHNYLNKFSNETINVYTAALKTTLSLPFLLGKMSPNYNCRYPFLRGAIKPNLLINSKFIATNNSLCPKIYNSISRNSFVRLPNKVRNIIDTEYINNLKKERIDCSFKNIKTIDKIINRLNNKNFKKENLNIIHEFAYHSDEEGRTRLSSLPYYDKYYLESIKYLIKNLKKSTEIDELIVMNDHGPRITPKYTSEYKDKSFTSLYDDLFYGVFVSRIKISDRTNYLKINKLEDLVPSSKDRYCEDGFYKVFKIDSLLSIDDCINYAAKFKM